MFWKFSNFLKQFQQHLCSLLACLVNFSPASAQNFLPPWRQSESHFRNRRPINDASTVKPLLHGSGWQMECAYSAWDWCLPEWRISQEFAPTSVGPETSDSWIVTRRYFYLWSKLFIQHPTIGPGWSRFNRKFWEITELGFHPSWHFFLIWFANEKKTQDLWLNEWMSEWMNGWVKQTKVSPIDGWK